MAGKKASATVEAIGGQVPTNGAEESIRFGRPYVAAVKVVGTADMLFHRWNCEAVQEKADAAKGSKAKKTDNVESYIWRDAEGRICLPGEYLRQCVIHAAKFRQDPRSPRKSAMDLYKAGVIALTHLTPIVNSAGKETSAWDYDGKHRVSLQRASITRVRPAFLAGWSATIQMMVNLPEYIRPADLHDVLTDAGRLIGLADFRPTYGRFMVSKFDVGLE